MKTDLTLISVRVADWLLDVKDYVFGVKATMGDVIAVLLEFNPTGRIKVRAWRIGPFVIIKRRRKQ